MLIILHLTEEILKHVKFSDRVRITKFNNTFRTSCTRNWSKEMILNDSVLNTYPWTYKFKNLNGETITRSFNGKLLFIFKYFKIKSR